MTEVFQSKPCIHTLSWKVHSFSGFTILLSFINAIVMKDFWFPLPVLTWVCCSCISVYCNSMYEHNDVQTNLLLPYCISVIKRMYFHSFSYSFSFSLSLWNFQTQYQRHHIVRIRYINMLYVMYTLHIYTYKLIIAYDYLYTFMFHLHFALHSCKCVHTCTYTYLHSLLLGLLCCEGFSIVFYFLLFVYAIAMWK